MPPLNQENLPLVFVLWGGGLPLIALFNVPQAGVHAPSHLSLRRPARGTVTGTAGRAFLDDFGQGVPQLVIAGNTGWNESPIAGMPMLKLLEALFIEYLNRRRRLTEQGQDPNTVRLYYLDALNAEAFELYPHEWTLERTRTSPLLYMYHMRFSVLRDLLQEVVYDIIDYLSQGLDTILTGLGDLFGRFNAVGDGTTAGGFLNLGPEDLA